MSRIGCALVCLMLSWPAVAQREFQEFMPFERRWGDGGSLPADYEVPGEFVVGRLMFPNVRFGNVFGDIMPQEPEIRLICNTG